MVFCWWGVGASCFFDIPVVAVGRRVAEDEFLPYLFVVVLRRRWGFLGIWLCRSVIWNWLLVRRRFCCCCTGYVSTGGLVSARLMVFNVVEVDKVPPDLVFVFNCQNSFFVLKFIRLP